MKKDWYDIIQIWIIKYFVGWLEIIILIFIIIYITIVNVVVINVLHGILMVLRDAYSDIIFLSKGYDVCDADIFYKNMLI